MIRLSGLINLQALKEQDEPAKEPEHPAPFDSHNAPDNDLLKQKLTKLQSMELSPDQQKKVEEMLAKLQELTGNQDKLDVDGDGEIEASDLQKLRAGDKTDEVVVLENDGEEARMAKSDLIAMQHKLEKLIQSMGDNDELEAWVQSKITLAADYIGAVYDRMHGTKGDPDPTTDTVNEAAATGWEKTVLAMKKHKEIDNPWALSHWMKKKGYHPQNESVNEISPTTATSYKNKAKADRSRTAQDYYDFADDMTPDERKSSERKIDKRSSGIKNANSIINKARRPGETWKTDSGKNAKKNSDGTITYTENESIEEIGTLKKAAYIAKAAKDVWKQRGYEKDSEKQANAEPRIGKSGKETPASARDRAGARASADMSRKRINKRVKGIDNARGFKGNDVKVKNPETGKEILAKSAASDPNHPAHSAAKSALRKK
jgi:hypothetical protein